MRRRQVNQLEGIKVSLRLDPELDADLIAWFESQPAGRRSEALRSLLRDGLRERKSQAELVMAVRQAVSEALAGLQVMAVQQGVALDANEVEDTFGAKLDQMLGGLD